jgi:lysine/ornithine N-monooxygenase
MRSIPSRSAYFSIYAEWSREQKDLDVRQDFVTKLEKPDGRFVATLGNGEQITAEAVVAAPGIQHYTHVPEWAASLPPRRGTHTCDLVSFDQLAGARVLIVGGRQSAYEWAALILEHGAERIEIVHRHDVPRFDDGFPALDESLQTTTSGLYITGFSATKDFGPFFGFVKAAPAPATLIVRHLLSRTHAGRIGATA